MTVFKHFAGTFTFGVALLQEDHAWQASTKSIQTSLRAFVFD